MRYLTSNERIWAVNASRVGRKLVSPGSESKMKARGGRDAPGYVRRSSDRKVSWKQPPVIIRAQHLYQWS